MAFRRFKARLSVKCTNFSKCRLSSRPVRTKSSQATSCKGSRLLSRQLGTSKCSQHPSRMDISPVGCQFQSNLAIQLVADNSVGTTSKATLATSCQILSHQIAPACRFLSNTVASELKILSNAILPAAASESQTYLWLALSALAIRYSCSDLATPIIMSLFPKDSPTAAPSFQIRSNSRISP